MTDALKNISKGWDAILAKWLHLDVQFFAKGQNLSGDSTDERIHQALFQSWDAKAAEAIHRTEDANPIFKLRSLIFRGSLAEAEPYVQELLQQTTTSDGLVELFLERARLEGFRGEWAEVIATCNRALEINRSPVTQLSLLECRALAFYESGLFQNSLRDLDQIDSLGRCIPYSIDLLYGQAIRIRIMARSQGSKLAQMHIARLWREFKTLHTLDTVLTLLRLEVDVARVAGESSFFRAVAAYLIAIEIGDELYINLALLDVWASSAREQGHEVEPSLALARKKFVKIDKLLSEAEGGPCTTTGATLHAALRKKTEGLISIQAESLFRCLAGEIQTLVLLQAGLILQLRDRAIHPVAIEDQHSRAFEALRSEKISKEKFFSEVWGYTYRKALHDEALRALLSRLRRKYKAPILTESSGLSARQMWVISHD